eukprot:TRINITY_DN28133_c0_g1_i1.p1 TRINITY_DN28133_c0_g1~~TRINITY_DN28133_c0_g1_i1.p1  ORF type:complete len:194 (+),score=49.37 TRINITY_DN28133_c0_g1_i1:60-584(+)
MCIRDRLHSASARVLQTSSDTPDPVDEVFTVDFTQMQQGTFKLQFGTKTTSDLTLTTTGAELESAWNALGINDLSDMDIRIQMLRNNSVIGFDATRAQNLCNNRDVTIRYVFSYSAPKFKLYNFTLVPGSLSSCADSTTQNVSGTGLDSSPAKNSPRESFRASKSTSKECPQAT